MFQFCVVASKEILVMPSAIKAVIGETPCVSSFCQMS